MTNTFTQYHCPDCHFKTDFAHHNTALAQLRKHRALERAIAMHPAGSKLSTAKEVRDNLSTDK